MFIRDFGFNKLMKLGVLFSGGKDSCLALHKAKQDNEILFLLGVFPENTDSFMFHKPNLKLLKKQAKMLDIPLIIKKTKGEEEKELKDLEILIQNAKNKGAESIVVGGIASNYQGERIKKICNKLNLRFIAPLWGYTSEMLWQELLKENFKIILTKISSQGIGKEWIGKEINKENFKELKKLSEKYKFRLDFEGGEAESAVLFMPGFKKEIKLNFNIKDQGEFRHFIEITKML